MACWLDFAVAKNFEKDIGAIIKKYGDINFGVYVVNAETNQPLITIHPSRVFVPASLTKIVGSYFALKKLGANYRYNTEISYDKISVKDNTLNSNLFIKFTGDPTLTEEGLYSLLDPIKRKSIKKISSNIIIDDSFFDDHWTSAGGFTWDDRPFCNSAPKSAIIINENCSKAYQWPSKIGEKARLEILQPYLLSFKNDVKTVSNSHSGCEYKSKYIGKNQYLLFGCMKNNTKKTKLNFALPNNRKMLTDYLVHWLAKERIKFDGKILYKKQKGKSRLSNVLSPELSEILHLSLKDSNNLVAGALYKTVSAELLGSPGSDEESNRLLKGFLRELGIKSKYMKIYGGSGESKYNQISPKALVKLLRVIYKDQKYFPIMLNAFPEHAKEGTLKYRNNLGQHSKRLKVKTGSLKTSSGIAGYYLGKKKYVFAFMMNNQNIPYVSAKALEDEVLNYIFSQLA